MIKQSLQLITAQTQYCVSLSEAKSQLRVDTTDEDTLIQDLIYVAQSQVEDYCNLDLTPATYDLNLTDFPTKYITLPKWPVSSITSVKYYDSAGVQQTWAGTNYYFNAYAKPAIVFYTDSASLPSLTTSRFDIVTVRFVTGWTSPELMPKMLKQAVLIALTDLYETRGDSPRERVSNWQHLCLPFKVHHSTVENGY